MILTIALQTATDLKDVLSTNDVTVMGILISIILALGYVVRHLYLKNETMHKEYITEMKGFTELLIQVNKEYDKTANNLMDLFKNK
jgi:hypothetical protein